MLGHGHLPRKVVDLQRRLGHLSNLLALVGYMLMWEFQEQGLKRG